MKPTGATKDDEGLFADCREGNHRECMFQYPNAYSSVDESQSEYLITCTCNCHGAQPATPSTSAGGG